MLPAVARRRRRGPAVVAAVIVAAAAVASTALAEQPRFAGDWGAECNASTFYAPVAGLIEAVASYNYTAGDGDFVNVSGANAADDDTIYTRTAARRALWELVTHRHNIVPYTSSGVDAWDALMFLDRANASAASASALDRVVEVYSQRAVPVNMSGETDGWNREHIFPKSYGVGYDGPDTSDLHALRPADWGVNSARSNRFFDWCPVGPPLQCTAPAHPEAAVSTAKDAVRFQPPEAVRGDIARAVFYMALRYDAGAVGGAQEPDTQPLLLGDCPCSGDARLGVLSTLVQWHRQDPPDAREVLRSAETCARYQRNRNPFADAPGLAEFLFAALAEDEAAAGECPVCVESGVEDDDDAVDGGSADVLSPCDVVVVGFNVYGGADAVVLAALVPLEAGQRVRVTDNTYRGAEAGGFRTTEGVLTFTAPAGGVAAGDILYWEDGGVGMGGSWAEDGSFILSLSGDTVVVYAGASGGNASFSFAVDNTDDGWDDPAAVSTWTAGMGAEPEPLRDHVAGGGVALQPAGRNFVFRLPEALAGGASKAAMCMAVSNSSNWESSREWFHLNATAPFTVVADNDTAVAATTAGAAATTVTAELTGANAASFSVLAAAAAVLAAAMTTAL